MKCSKSRDQFDDFVFQSDRDLVDTESDTHVQHLLVHHGGGHDDQGQAQCLVWACRACKRMRRVMDRRAMATVRERKRLGKVKFQIQISNTKYMQVKQNHRVSQK